MNYWLVAVVPIIIMHICKDKLSDYGFTNENILRQIIKGISIGMAFSFVFILLPYFAVELVEEFVFRGFLYVKIKRTYNDTGAVMFLFLCCVGLYEVTRMCRYIIIQAIYSVIQKEG